MDSKKLVEQLEVWRRELIDFSRRNRLLNLSGRAVSVPLIEPPAETILELLVKGKSLQIYPEKVDEPDANDESTIDQPKMESAPVVLRLQEVRSAFEQRPKLATYLRTLRRRSDQEFLDKGIRILYLAIGTLHWEDGKEKWSSPILMTPIEFEKPVDDVFKFRLAEGEITLNPALVEKLREDMGVEISSVVSDEDPFGSLRELRAAVSNRNNWSVEETATIGIFSFAKEVMFRDLLDHEDEILKSELVAALAFGSESGTNLGFDLVPEESLDLVFPPSRLSSILDTDATQRQAIIAAKEGHSFVIDGPPGSGKSQTIANIIAEVIGDGRCVLFVSEKAAALEVVQNRLDEAGLGSFLLPLHSQKISRKDFANLLRKAVTERARAGSRLTATQLERLDTNQKSLSSYVAAVNEIRVPLGKSLYQAIGEHASLKEVPNAPIPTKIISKTLEPSRFLEIEDTARRLSMSWMQISSPSDFVWRGLINSRGAQESTSQILTSVEALIDNLIKMVQHSEDISDETGIPRPETVEQIRRLMSLESLLKSPEHPPASWITFENLDDLRVSVQDLLSQIGAIQSAEEECLLSFPTWKELSETIGNQLRDASAEVPLDDEFKLPDCQSIEEFEALISKLRRVARNLVDAIILIKDLEERFGDSKGEMTVMRGLTLAKAAHLAASAHRPETIWFSAIGIAKADEAISLVEPLVQDYWRRAQLLDAFFQEGIRDFPIDELFPAGASEPLLGFLSGQGRVNRKALANLTRSGKLTKVERNQLSAVRALHHSAQSIDAESAIKQSLGTFYFQGVSTDFDSLKSALEGAKAAVLTLKSADPGKLADALSRVALDATETAGKGQAIDDAIREADTLSELLLGRAIESKLQVAEIAEHFEEVANGWAEIHDLLSPSFNAMSLPTKEIYSLVMQRTKLADEIRNLENNSINEIKLFETLYAGAGTSIDDATKSLEWAIDVRQALPSIPTRSLATRIVDGEMEFGRELATTIVDFDLSMAALTEWFSPERRVDLQSTLETDLELSLAYLRTMVDEVDQINEAVNYEQSVSEMREYGLSEIADYLVDQKVPSNQIVSIVTKALLASWIESIITTDKKRLSPLEKESRDLAVREFADIDKQLKHDAARRVAEAANDRRPKALIGQVSIIQRQASLKSRHMRIVELLLKTNEVAQTIVPCFMMSPISVSTYLPSTMKFDLVIFDEASQMLTSNAINAIYRARQLIVAGDERQLPPTSFFDRGLDENDSDEYLEDGLEEFESVLHQAKSGGFEQVGLRWHYRSRHESLITYSNYSFYNGELITYPSALQDSPDLGVSFVYVPNGIYKRGGSRTNTIEAQKVVERILYFADNHPELSLGVVAFSVAQATEIENQLDAVLRSRPDLDEYFTADRLHGVFIKNLESVQGDERDVIIFSVGYGKDEHGKLTMDFGPVSRKGGWRRLNVAFTRARNRVELVASITAGDFSDTENTNVNHLKRYFDYAERGPSALAFEVSSSNQGPEGPFEEEVIQCIRSWGYDVDPQVGQAGYRIDMAVRDPKRPGAYVLGIECDGAAYHSSQVARDRDRLRQEVLEGLGWRLYRIWGPTWYRSRTSAERELKAAIDEAISYSQMTRESSSEHEPLNVENATVDIDFDDVTSFVKPYFASTEPEALKLEVNSNGLITPAAIQSFILAVVRREGPVSINIVKRRFAHAAGLNLGKKVQAALNARLDALVREKKLKVLKPDCLIIPGPIDFIARRPYPGDELTKRDATNVAFIEIAAGIVNFLRLASPIDIDEIEQLVAKQVFGWDRVTAKWKDAIEETLEALISEGWWTVQENRINKGPNFPTTATTITFR